MNITGENASNGRRGTGVRRPLSVITQQEEETQVDHVKMETMSEKVALAGGRHWQELIISHVVSTTVNYRPTRRHGAQVNRWKLIV